MTIDGLKEDIITRKWKYHKRRRYIYGYENRFCTVNIGPFWEFDQEISKDYFEGTGLNYSYINNINSHSFNVGISFGPTIIQGKWFNLPYYLRLSKKLKVKLA